MRHCLWNYTSSLPFFQSTRFSSGGAGRSIDVFLHHFMAELWEWKSGSGHVPSVAQWLRFMVQKRTMCMHGLINLPKIMHMYIFVLVCTHNSSRESTQCFMHLTTCQRKDFSLTIIFFLDAVPCHQLCDFHRHTLQPRSWECWVYMCALCRWLVTQQSCLLH